MKLWGGRFHKSTDKIVEEFTTSLSFDKRLFKEDIAGSIAHVKMLAKQEIISQEDSDAIQEAIQEIYREIEAGQFAFDIGDEDIHMAIERALIEKIGPVGGKLHTARSRNDQVALDTRLYLKKEIIELCGLVMDFQEVLISKSHEHVKTIIPGYTHMQRAQPLLLSHHLLAYFFMLQRDFYRLYNSYRETDVMPLGSAALAGTSFPIDRRYVADELGFARVSENSLDSVSDRDFVIQFLAAASQIMAHLSRLSEELIIWSTQEFNFIVMDDSHTTGSSIMPQKKNPDIAELVRGKTGRVYGNLMSMLTVMKGLPLAYNRDLQEDKEGLFDTIDTVKLSLLVLRSAIKTMAVNTDKMAQAVQDDYITATDYADYLVKKGMPFRVAHEVVGELVKGCVDQGKKLSDLSLSELKKVNNLFDADALELADPRRAVESRVSQGGTSSPSVNRQLAQAAKILSDEKKWLEKHLQKDKE